MSNQIILLKSTKQLNLTEKFEVWKLFITLTFIITLATILLWVGELRKPVYHSELIWLDQQKSVIHNNFIKARYLKNNNFEPTFKDLQLNKCFDKLENLNRQPEIYNSTMAELSLAVDNLDSIFNEFQEMNFSPESYNQFLKYKDDAKSFVFKTISAYENRLQDNILVYDLVSESQKVCNQEIPDYYKLISVSENLLVGKNDFNIRNSEKNLVISKIILDLSQTSQDSSNQAEKVQELMNLTYDLALDLDANPCNCSESEQENYFLSLARLESWQSEIAQGLNSEVEFVYLLNTKERQKV